jgi:type I restriction enzyme R subunit
MNEADTRAQIIDPKLKDAGWEVLVGARVQREYKITNGQIQVGTKPKPVVADYVLVYKGRKLAVIEAKSDVTPVSEGVAQAKQYAGMLSVDFTYSSNGNSIYAINMKTGKEGLIDKFPTPDELWQATFVEQNLWRDNFDNVPFEDVGGTRKLYYYQENAVNKAMTAIADGKERILLTLATGTGKTFIAFQIAWKLFKTRWTLKRDGSRLPRILFLADRNILANQAYNNFSSFNEDALVRIKPDEISKKGKVPTNGSVFFTIFQTFMTESCTDAKSNNSTDAKSCASTDNKSELDAKSCVSTDNKSGLDAKSCVSTDNKSGLDAKSCVSTDVEKSYNFGQYPPDFFDFIIIDECHRGGANDESSWRGILEYFKPAVQLGLTATPKRKDNVDTYLYFGDPVYIYSLKQGINDGFLTPFKVKRIQTTLDTYIYDSEDIVIDGEIQEGKEYTENDFNKIIKISAREKKRVKIFMDDINQNEKTIVFCATQDHAAAVRDLINQYKTSKNPNYCVRVTANDGELGEQYLREFQDNEKTIPTILTTSQKLSTGVDARNIRNIILMRPVNSMIEFKQIIGRGTRLFEGKEYFTLYDYVNAYKHFIDPEWDGEPLTDDPCKICGNIPCTCEKQPPKPCKMCGKMPCICIKDPPVECPKCGKAPCECPKKVIIKLSDGKEREIQHMIATSFWSPDGKPISAKEFLDSLFGTLTGFFASEDELRTKWSNPISRKELLAKLSDAGFGKDELLTLQKLINAEKSDIFDVLEYVAYAIQPITREMRATSAKPHIFTGINDKQREFLEFVLAKYIETGVEELDQEKLPQLMILKYHDINDAVSILGGVDFIQQTFIGFQKYLYA